MKKMSLAGATMALSRWSVACTYIRKKEDLLGSIRTLPSDHDIINKNKKMIFEAPSFLEISEF